MASADASASMERAGALLRLRGRLAGLHAACRMTPDLIRSEGTA